VSWARVCRPVNRGGLGITDLERFGRILRLRWLWLQWKNPDRPWCGTELPIDSVDTALFAAATRVQVRNGRKAMFWTSSWLHGTSPASLFPALYQHCKRKKRTVAEALEDDNWIRDIMQLFSDYVLLWGLVDEANLDPSTQGEDEIFWTRMSDASYSARSTNGIQFDGSIESSFPTTVWRVWAPSRCKFFMWLLLQNRVWTADRLVLREWPNNYFCPLCWGSLETAAHLLCPVARQVWRDISAWTAAPEFNPQLWLPDQGIAGWFEELTKPSVASSAKKKGARSLAILVCWSIWRERNARVFEAQEKTIARLITEIKDEAGLWIMAGARHLSFFVSSNARE
jgi:hypothetical protein